MRRSTMKHSALVVIDVQNCFCPGGSLPVEEGDKVVPVMNEYIDSFTSHGLPVYATRDWHPPVTRHFIQFGGLWPPHCIRNTAEAEFHPDLRLPEDVEVVSAGVGPEDQGYSGFEGTNQRGEYLEESLKRRGIDHLYIGGIATDYCVKETVLDARRRGFQTTLLVDAIKAVNVKPHDDEKAIQAMKSAGADVKTLHEVEQGLEN
jgi:nicotinamidase/pyrazinamidase